MIARLTAGLFAIFVLCTSASALDIGDKAPALNIANWVKGKEVKSFEKGHVYVIEFWATWCPPCRTSIPHLTELQKQYKGKVSLIGISDEDLNTVEGFVTKQGDAMDYIVAVDNNRASSKAYMEAMGQSGIPHAYIVDQNGILVHHCHPMALDSALAAVVAGTFKPQNEAKIKKLYEAYFSGLAAGKSLKELRPAGEELLALAKDNSELLNEFAWTALTDKRFSKRDYEFLKKVAYTAHLAAGKKNAAIADTYARALFDSGERKKGIEVQRLAVKLAAQGEMKAELEATLEGYLAKMEGEGEHDEEEEEEDHDEDEDEDEDDEDDEDGEDERPQLDPKLATELQGLFTNYFQGLATGKSLKEVRPFGDKIHELCEDHPDILNQFAWAGLTNENFPKRDYDLLTSMAKTAYNATKGKNAAITDTYARALYDSGKKKKAIRLQRKAVALAEQEELKAELEATLERYLEEAKGSDEEEEGHEGEGEEEAEEGQEPPLDPAVASELQGLFQNYFQGISTGKSLKEVRPHGERVLELCKEHPSILNQFAWAGLTNENFPKRDYELLTKMSRAAFKATNRKNAAIADTLARALFDSGKQKAGIRMQRKAVALAKEGEEKDELEKTLAGYLKKQAKPKGKTEKL